MKKIILPRIKNVMSKDVVDIILSGQNMMQDRVIQISRLEFECFLYGHPEICEWLQETSHKYSVIKKFNSKIIFENIDGAIEFKLRFFGM